VHTRLGEVTYHYGSLVADETTRYAGPHSGGVLEQVKHRVTANPVSFVEAWHFTYRYSPALFYLTGKVGKTAAQFDYHGSYYYLPLHSVTSPKGAQTSYEYDVLGDCEYQDSNQQEYRNTEYCPNFRGQPHSTDKVNPRRPIVVKRTLEGSGNDGIQNQVTTFEYDRFDNYRVEREISNEQTINRLEFGRINHSTRPFPLFSYASEPVTGDTLIRGGKLLVHELLDATSPSKPALVSTSYE
jgi:hypothetical protein